MKEALVLEHAVGVVERLGAQGAVGRLGHVVDDVVCRSGLAARGRAGECSSARESSHDGAFCSAANWHSFPLSGKPPVGGEGGSARARPARRAESIAQRVFDATVLADCLI